MNMLLKLGAAACLFAAAVQAQHLTVLSATHILDTTGALGNGTLCFIPSASPYTPSGVSPQSGNTCYTVTAGMISGASLYDAAYITPQGFSYTYRFTQTSGSVVVLTIPSIQITGTLFNLDTYAIPSAIRASGNGTPNVNCQAGARFVQLDAPTTLNTWTCVALNGVTKWYLDPTQVSGNPAGTGLASPGTDNVLLAYMNGLLTRPATFADLLPIISGTPSSLTFINGLGQWATPAGAGNVSTSGSMANGNVPKSTGVTTLTDGGQPYPSSAFVGITDTQPLTHKNLNDPSNTFPVFNQSTTGKSSTTDAFATAPSGCAANFVATGVDIHGNPISCANGGCLNIINYGGNNSGSGSNNTAFSALRAASISENVCVYFPPGKYLFNSSPSWTAPTTSATISIRGDSPGVSQLLFPNANSGLLFAVIGNGNTVHVRDISLRTGGAGTSNGIAIINSGVQTGFAASDITNVQFYGMDGYAATDYWNIGIVADAFSNLNINNVGFVGHPSGTSGLGLAVDLQSTTSVVGAIFNITQLDVAYSSIALQVNDHIQGVTISDSNATAVNYGVLVPAGIPYGDNDELMIGPGNQFAATVSGISISSPFRHTQVFNNYCLNSGSANCMVFDHYAMTSVIGNQFIQIGPGTNSAILFDHYSNDDAKVFGNDSQFFTIGLNLTANSQHVTAFMNNGVGNGVDTSNLGTGNAVSLSAFTGSPTAAFQVVDGFVVHQ